MELCERFFGSCKSFPDRSRYIHEFYRRTFTPREFVTELNEHVCDGF